VRCHHSLNHIRRTKDVIACAEAISMVVLETAAQETAARGCPADQVQDLSVDRVGHIQRAQAQLHQLRHTSAVPLEHGHHTVPIQCPTRTHIRMISQCTDTRRGCPQPKLPVDKGFWMPASCRTCVVGRRPPHSSFIPSSESADRFAAHREVHAIHHSGYNRGDRAVRGRMRLVEQSRPGSVEELGHATDRLQLESHTNTAGSGR
jgi:hypothetical protein